MILVDTSVWVDHFRRRSDDLVRELEQDRVLTHPFIIGELALSGLVRRDEILGLLGSLPRAVAASHEETINAVQRWHLDGRGVGWVDAHLYASALLSAATLWTNDKRLRDLSAAAGMAFTP
jgi:predicted nucleic acid-binding protein